MEHLLKSCAGRQLYLAPNMRENGPGEKSEREEMATGRWLLLPVAGTFSRALRCLFDFSHLSILFSLAFESSFRAQHFLKAKSERL